MKKIFKQMITGIILLCAVSLVFIIVSAIKKLPTSAEKGIKKEIIEQARFGLDESDIKERIEALGLTFTEEQKRKLMKEIKKELESLELPPRASPREQERIKKEMKRLKIPVSDEKVARLKKEVELNPNSAHAHDMLASAYWTRREIDLAIEEAREAIRLTPNDGLRHFILGDCYSEKGLLDKAIYEYEKAASLEPQIAMYLFSLGEAYWKKNMLKEALTSFKRVEKLGGITRMGAKQNIKFIEAGVSYVERYLGIPDERYVTIDKQDPYLMAKAVGYYRAQEKKEPANLEELVGTYIAAIRKDGWGTPYRLDSKKNAIISAGKDKRFGTKDDEISYPIPKIHISGKPLVKTYGEITIER